MSDCRSGAYMVAGQAGMEDVFARVRVRLGWCGVDMLVARGFIQRLGGLVPVTPSHGRKTPGMAFPRCDSVHTCFMRYPIDIAFIDVHGEVLELYEGVAPWRIVRCRGAWGVMEKLSLGSSKAFPAARSRKEN